MKRESFVFHAEYIDDLPDDYKADFSEEKKGLYKLQKTWRYLQKTWRINA